MTVLRPDPASRGLGMTSQRARDRLVERLAAEGIRDRRVLDVIRQLPRHLFIDEALASRAYEDTALPIGQGQTISQPWVVARMTEALIEHGLPRRVLEIGTGSGYQCAVLAQLVEKVYTVERIEELLRNARRRFRKLGIEQHPLAPRRRPARLAGGSAVRRDHPHRRGCRAGFDAARSARARRMPRRAGRPRGTADACCACAASKANGCANRSAL